MKTTFFISSRHRKTKYYYPTILFFILFFKFNIFAQPILIISSDKEKYVLDKYLEIFEDKERKITFSEIQSLKYNTLFKQNTSGVPNYGYTKSAFWVRFKLKNTLKDTSTLLIDFKNANMHYINAYIPVKNGYKEIKTGKLLPLSTRDRKNRDFIFYISLPKDSLKIVYMRFVNGSSMSLPLILLKQNAFENQKNYEISFFGFLYGALIIMIIYNIFIFLSFQQRYYLYYISLIFNFLFFHTSYSGIGSLYLWPNNYLLKLYLVPVFIVTGVTAFLKFHDTFFDLKTNDPYYHKIINYNILILFISLISLPVFEYHYFIQPILLITLLGILFSFYLGIHMWKRGFRESRYFLFAWIWFGLGTFLTILTRFDVLESSFVTDNGYALGMLLLVLFFSLALADKFNVLQKKTDRINKQLAQSEDRFKKLSNLTFEGVLIHKNGVIIDCNDPFLKMLEYMRNDIIGQNVVELVVQKNDRKNVYNHFYDRSTEPQTISCINKRGAKLAIEIETRMINENDKIYVSTFKNISERKRSQIINDVLSNIATAINFTDDLKDLNNILKEELNILFDTTDFYVALYDKKENRLSLPYKKNGDKEIHLLEEFICGIVIKENKALMLKEKEIQKYLENEILKNLNHLPKVWLGVPFYLDNEIRGISVLQSYKNEDTYKQSDLSLLEFISKQVTDEIKRKQTDDQIRILTLSVEQSPVSIVITDLNGNIEYVNPSFIKTTGYTRDEVIGQNPRVLKSGKLSEQIYKDLWDTISSGHEWRGEFLNKKKNNEFYWESAVISPVINEKGEVKHYMAIKEDITEQKLLQQQLQQSQKMDSLGKLASGVAHDFNNLLTVINGFSEIVLTKIDENNKLYRDISSIHSAGKKAENLVRQLLSFSSLQTYQPEILNINDIISNLNKMMRRLISEDITIKINIAKDLSFVLGNQGQFEQVLMNLIVNARDAINQKTKKSYEKKIEIITSDVLIDENEALIYPESRQGQYVLLTIIDNGIGMNEEILSKIFEPFYTTKETGKGTGLGLATVYGIVKQNNGWINVSSLSGVGTTFKIYWPTTEKEEDNFDETNESKEDFLNGGDETILLVEDDGDVRELVQSALENYGYKVYVEVDGLKGIQFLKNSNVHIDLLITDIVMPNLNGKELAEQALNLQPDLHVLYTSGYTDDQLVTDGELEKGINFLQKPYSVVILLKKVRKILDSV